MNNNIKKLPEIRNKNTLLKNLAKNYINENARFYSIWNYNEIIYEQINNDMLFFTNNICES